jgi:endoribonuclease Dicer
MVFDECHHATGNHPYSQIMSKIKEQNAEKKHEIKIFGLTASIVSRKSHIEGFKKEMKAIEDKFE